MEGNLSSPTIGWTAIATGVAVILAVTLLILFFIMGNSFGTLNDIFNGIAGVSSGLLAWMLYVEHHAKSPFVSQIALALAWVGAVVGVVGSVLIILDFTGFVLAGFYTAVGNALIGLWLVTFCYSMPRSNTLPPNLIMFGLVVGACMALGLIAIPGIFAGIDTLESMPWYLYIGFSGFLGIYVLYPIWTIWLGRILLPKL